MTYFHMGNPHYHRRKVVSLSCSGWEGVGPTRYGRQTNCCRQSGYGIQDSVNPHTARRILEEVKLCVLIARCETLCYLTL